MTLTFPGWAGLLSSTSISDLRSQAMNADAVGMDLGGELSAPLAVRAQKRHISPFAMGLLGTPAVESMPAMAKAAAQPGTRSGGKLTQAQLDARAQQRTEDDELIREAQRVSVRLSMPWCGDMTSRCFGWRCICSAMNRTRRTSTRRPLSRRTATWGTSGLSAAFIRGFTGLSRIFAWISCDGERAAEKIRQLCWMPVAMRWT